MKAVCWTWSWPWGWHVYAWDDEANDFAVSRVDPRQYWAVDWSIDDEWVYLRLLGLEVSWVRK